MSFARLIGIFTLLMIVAFVCTTCTKPSVGSKEHSQSVAEEFVRLETTFRFDGIPETLEVTSTTSVGNGWQFTI